jgi:hypothetical protein
MYDLPIKYSQLHCEWLKKMSMCFLYVHCPINILVAVSMEGNRIVFYVCHECVCILNIIILKFNSVFTIL